MNQELKYWLSTIVITISIALLAAGTNNYVDNAAMLAMMTKGATAVEARCAVKDVNSSYCAVLAAKK